MDEFLKSDLPWELKAAASLGLGLLVALGLLAIPKRLLGRWGQLPFLSPNWISLWRAPLFWLGANIYFFVSPFWGFIMIVVACCMDILDGKMATALNELGFQRTAASTEIGKWLDPLIDKLTLLPLLGIFALHGVVNGWLVGLMIGIDVVGTLLRAPVNFAHRLQRQSSATAPGKIKTLMLSFSLICCAPYDLHWFKEPNIPNVVVSIALCLGIVSVLSRIRTTPIIEYFIDRAGTLFTHEDI